MTRQQEIYLSERNRDNQKRTDYITDHGVYWMSVKHYNRPRYFLIENEPDFTENLGLCYLKVRRCTLATGEFMDVWLRID